MRRLKTMAEDDEMLQHIVDIDEYTQITLRIPKKLHIEDLMGLVIKTKKLFSISEAKIASNKRYQRQVLGIQARGGNPSMRGKGNSEWTSEKDEILLKMRKAGKSFNEISNAVGIDKKKCDKHFYYLTTVKGRY
jgi:hypothetical protein